MTVGTMLSRGAEITGQSVAVRSEVARLSERAEASGASSRSESAVRAGQGLGSTSAGSQACAQRHRDADGSSRSLIRINFIDSTHCRVLVFQLLLKSS